MANDRVPDPAISINLNLPVYADMDRLYYEDAIEESLNKAQALILVFTCAFLDDYDEHTLQSFSAAILDNVRIASEAWKGLRNMR
jgi:hypothetical protein